VQLSTQLSYAGGFKEAVELVVKLDQIGLDVAWVPEAYSLDAVSLLGFLAARTSRVQLGSAILPIYSRTPALLAMTAAGLDHLSDGRFLLGLGASGPQVVEGWHGVPYDAPLARTREIVEICRRIWARDGKLVADGPHYPIPLPAERGTGLGRPLKLIADSSTRVPVYLAALGERNVALAAEVAEGWLPLLYLPERAAEAFGHALDAGRARRDPSLPDLDVCAGGIACFGSAADVREALDTHARAHAALYIGGMGAPGRNFYNALVCRYGYAEEAAAIQERFLAGRKAEAEALVPLELLELTNLCGSPGFVTERIEAYDRAGVTILDARPVGPDPVGTMRQLRSML
jgi:F420-dependent oxidoreductase-like protein